MTWGGAVVVWTALVAGGMLSDVASVGEVVLYCVAEP